MAKEFDPYYEWLGIPRKDQPPNHYRLLGIELFEANRAVIDTAANRQMGFIKEYQAGEHSELTQRLLNELAAARLCLLNQERKAAYDEQLRAVVKSDGKPQRDRLRSLTVESRTGQPTTRQRRPNTSRSSPFASRWQPRLHRSRCCHRSSTIVPLCQPQAVRFCRGCTSPQIQQHQPPSRRPVRVLSPE